ncbi:MAG: zinc dependent phospholipase C family protein [Saprospiraceae bacterium]
MKHYKFLIFFVLLSLVFVSFSNDQYQWGFFAHRRINRLAVFTLDPDMMPLFKNSIEFLTEHAVDPDKRRYAVKDEAPRHFIDLDRWYTNGELVLPKKYDEALARYGEFVPVDNPGAKGLLGNRSEITVGRSKYIIPQSGSVEDTNTYISFPWMKYFILSQVLPMARREDEAIFSGKSINDFFGKHVASSTRDYKWIDTFTIHGILPYQLPDRYDYLVQAFRKKDRKSILRLAGDIGHYVADAHVPLHTTSNYNGQLTNQLGLHAFWESRIPELFADKEYDYLVGKASYIKDIDSYVWDMVLKSHSYVDSVLAIEKRLSISIPGDQQYCFDERLGVTVRTQCEAYAKAYQKAMSGMVENRMREAILAVGSVWYSAWVDAGQPNLAKLNKDNTSLDEPEDSELDKAFKNNLIIGRPEN